MERNRATSPASEARRTATAMALLLAGAVGCAVVPPGHRTPAPAGPAPDLLDVTAIAPRIDAELNPTAKVKDAGPAPKITGTDRPESVPHDGEVARAATPPPSTKPPEAQAPALAPKPPEAQVPAPAPTPRSPDPVDDSPAPGSTTPPPLVGETSPEPRGPAGLTAPTIPEAITPYPIDLPTALRLADDQNPEIGLSRVAIIAATAQQLAAYSLLLPTLNAGANYDGHAGDLQRSTGQILNVSRQNAFVGNGGQVIGPSPINLPGINIFSALTDAIYQPLAARQAVAGARFNVAATANEVLLDVSVRYVELIGARAQLEAWRRSAAEADEIARIVTEYYLTGQGRKADADRAETQRRLFQAEIQHTEELVAVASARLSERLNLDAAVRLDPPSGQVVPLTIVDLGAPTEDLIRTAIRQRPDLKARQTDVNQAEIRHKRELARPLLPTLWLSFSGGSQGGGSNIVPPTLGEFGGRADFDARVYWTVLNGGFGNIALQRQQRAEVNQSIAARVRVLNMARDEVTSARAEGIAQGQKVETARVELASAEDGYREDVIHLRESLGRPIETLNSLVLLARSRINLIEAITRANQAQFRLYVALGTPPPLGPNAGDTPPGPPPIANPLNSPLVSRPVPLINVPPPGPPLLGQ